MTRGIEDGELVVLVSDDGMYLGTQSKIDVHHEATPLHLAFSCYVFDDSSRLLITQRAAGKRTFPGVWTNSVCGHPRIGEELFAGVRRRVREELGVQLTSLRLVLPEFRYVATMASGVMENELCPVFVGTTNNSPRPDPREVAATAWTPWDEFSRQVLAGSLEVSPWCTEQIPELARLGQRPDTWPQGDAADLPVAALQLSTLSTR